MNKKRLLFISPVIPWPITRGSAQRTDQMLQCLHDFDICVHLLVLNKEESMTGSDAIQTRLQQRYPGFYIEVHSHPKFSKRKAFFRASTSFLKKIKDLIFNNHRVLGNEKDCHYGFLKLIEKKLNNNSYDIVWFNYLKVMPENFNYKNIKIVCDLHDLQLARAKNFLVKKKSIFNQKKFLRKFQQSENIRLQQCDLAISISYVETKKIKRLYKPKGLLITIPASNYIYTPVNFKKKYKYDLLFVGSRSSLNVDAICWFLNNCFEYIMTKFSNITLLIQGNIVTSKAISENSFVKKYPNNILLSNYVPCLQEIYELSRLVISPIRYGTGMKIKVIEALSYGKAIVATSIALEGVYTLGLIQPQDEAQDFIIECINILDNSCLQNKHEDISKLVFAQKHSFEIIKNQLKQALIDL